MTYRLNEIMEAIEASFPRDLAMSFDNPGLMCGHAEREVSRVMLALDADNLTIEHALSKQADALITHHPMLFSAIKNVNDLNPVGRKLLTLIEHNIPCYAMHTNFDIGIGGMGDEVAKRLGVKQLCPLEVTGEQNETTVGVGFIGELETPMAARELAAKVKELFHLNGIWMYDAGKPIRTIAVCPGSGKGMMDEVLFSGADAYITGDTGHHDGLDFKDAGITLIDAGHYGLEHVFTDVMEAFLKERFPELEILTETIDEREFL